MMSVIGDKRTEIMGLSIILIMIFHSSGWSPLTNGYPWCLFEIGVEVFLFLSGYGIFHSLSKNGNIKRFYLRRLVRILPAYLIVTIPFFSEWIFSHNVPHPILHVIYLISPIAPFTGRIFFWFIGAILCFYMVAPLYFKLIQRFRYHIVVPFVVLLIVSLYLHLVSNQSELILARIPIFLVGMSIYPYRNYKVSNKMLLISVILSVLLIMLSKEVGYHYIMFFLITPTLTILLALLAKAINSKILTFMGTITLELYLIHENIYLRPFLKMFSWEYSVVLAFVCSIPTAWVLHKICDILISSLRKRISLLQNI